MAERSGRPDKPEPRLSRTTAPDAAKEKRRATPSGKDVADPDQVWRTAGPADEPLPDENLERKRKERAPDGPLTNVRKPSAYGSETQADAMARQTGAAKDRAGIEKLRKQ